MNNDIKLEQSILEMYREIKTGKTDICKECISESKNSLYPPISIWSVGNKYSYSKHKVLFVGKNARGEVDESSKTEYYVDARKTAQDLWGATWAYWSYIRNIAEIVYPDSGIDSIAFTNIVKCNNSRTIDTTTDLQKQNCINKLQVVMNEIRLLKPRKIVFLTGRYYDNYIKEMFSNLEINKDDVQLIGKRKMPWMEFNGNIDGNHIECLRIGHPERKKKVDYVNMVSEWIER